MNDGWRWRLRDAIDATGRKHSDVARGAGITATTLSRVLNGDGTKPYFDTVFRLAREVGVTVGWLLNEPEFRIGAREQGALRDAAKTILGMTGGEDPQ